MIVPAQPGGGRPLPDISVIVVAICSVPQLRKCLEAIRHQNCSHSFEVIVAADPRIGVSETLRKELPDIVFIDVEGSGTPIELTTLALEVARGPRIALTEDSCIACQGWISSLVSCATSSAGAVGGAIEPACDVGPVMWAFCYVDFFRYMTPVQYGESPSLSVCNVMYSRDRLDEISDSWKNGFHETRVNDELKRKFGPLVLCPDAAVQVRRKVRLGGALYERYAFGRLFGATRIAGSSSRQRVFFSVAALALPFLLLGRMARKAFESRALTGRFLGALPSILAMAMAWSWGEWLGYLTATRPRTIETARELSP